MNLRIAVIGLRSLSCVGGTEHYVRELYSRLANSGHHITIYVQRRYHGEADRRVHQNIEVIPLWSPPIKGIETLVYAFHASVKALFGNFDLFHYQSLGPSAFSILPRLCRRTVVTTIQSQDWSFSKWGPFAKRFLRYGEAQAVRNSAAIICISQALKDDLLKTYGDTGKLLHVVHHGVTPPSTPINSHKIIEAFGLTQRNYALFVGRLVPEKNIETLIEAFNAMPDLKLALVGAPTYTESYALGLKQMVSSNRNIIFLGELRGADLAAVYSLASFLIHPSLNEGLGLVVIEAMAYGLPVILSDIPAHREIAETAAIYFDPSDSSAICTNVHKLMRTNTTRSHDVAETTRWALSKYNWTETARATEAIFTRACS